MRPEIPVEHLDELINARIPRDNVTLAAKIRKFMTHNKNHLTRETSRCRKGKKCIYGFPQPLSSQTTVDSDGRVHYKRTTEEDRWVVPHIPELVNELDCHVFVDVVFTVSIFTYLYKYLYKGPDHTFFHIPRQPGHPVNEIEDYVKGRYLSAHEAAWRILGYHITSKTPSVSSLPVHLPGENTPRFAGSHTSHEGSTSLLIRYFNRPDHPSFAQLKYTEYFKNFVWYKYNDGDVLCDDEFLEQSIPGCTRQKLSPRRVGTKVARLSMVSPTAGELFYIRCLLIHRPARSFLDLRTIDGNVFPSFHEAAVDVGLFANENEGHYAILEAIAYYYTPAQLRFLFARVVLEGYPAAPLWTQFHLNLAQDFIQRNHSHERGINQALQSIGDFLHDGGRSLKQFGLPEPIFRAAELVAELDAFQDRREELLLQVERQRSSMNNEQKHIFDSVVDCATAYRRHGHTSAPFFLEGQPGRGKTFVVDAICSQLRAQGNVVLVVGSSALAATLYERGRTAHNLFQIPVTDVRTSASYHQSSGCMFIALTGQRRCPIDHPSILRPCRSHPSSSTYCLGRVPCCQRGVARLR